MKTYSDATKEDIKFVLSRDPHLRVSGHGYTCYFLGRGVDNLGCEITLPKEWTWEQCEPFCWRVAAEFIRYREQLEEKPDGE